MYTASGFPPYTCWLRALAHGLPAARLTPSALVLHFIPSSSSFLYGGECINTVVQSARWFNISKSIGVGIVTFAGPFW
jgi:hypothetical protein